MKNRIPQEISDKAYKKLVKASKRAQLREAKRLARKETLSKVKKAIKCFLFMF